MHRTGIALVPALTFEQASTVVPSTGSTPPPTLRSEAHPQTDHRPVVGNPAQLLVWRTRI